MDTLNPFTKYWLKATLAPESITNYVTIKSGYMDAIENEDKTKRVIVMSTNEEVLGIGLTYKECIDSGHYTFKEAIAKIVELLELKHIIT